jgi:hypothetical protein
VYYLLPPFAVFAAAFMVFAFGKVSAFYLKFRNIWRKVRLQTVAFVLIVLVALVFLFRFGVVYGKINEASIYYSTSDIKGYDSGVWLRNNFPGETTAVVTEVPGFWFRIFSGKTVIAATDPVVDRIVISESVLDLSYELEHPQTLVRTYEAKGDISDESFVSVNDVWNRVSYSSGGGDFVSYYMNGVNTQTALSNFTREITLEEGSSPRLVIRYVKDALAITKTISFQNDSYPINVEWTLSALKGEVSNVVLYVSVFFDLGFSFEKAYLPGILNWENPWDKPTLSQGHDWATVDFSPSTLTSNEIGLYDENNAITFALKYADVPEWGNIGALANRQIDAIRFNCTFDKIISGQLSSFAYKVLTFSSSSNPKVHMPTDLKSLFEAKTLEEFEVNSHDYQDYIRENSIKFIVYDKNQFDTKMAQSKLLELIYSNDRYVIFKVKDSS